MGCGAGRSGRAEAFVGAAEALSLAEAGGVMTLNGSLNIEGGVTVSVPGPWDTAEYMTLAEAARKIDTLLGRWRSAEHPDYVVMPSDQFRANRGFAQVLIFHEPTHYAVRTHRAEETAQIDHNHPKMHFGAVAAEFFAAHPKVQPWHSAQPGEVWLVDGAPRAVIARKHEEPSTFADPFYRAPGIPVNHPEIFSARRIFPEAMA